MALLGCLVGALPSPGLAGEVPIRVATAPGGATARVSLESLEERRFRGVVRQRTDFSCGAAAVATLLSLHYGSELDEDEVFDAMWKAGDPQRIRAIGFSLLDMKRFMVESGHAADGYALELQDLAAAGIPAIALVASNGYFHFVVVTGISRNEVLLADPASGLREVSRAEFERSRDEVLLVIHPSQAASRPLRSSWKLVASSPESEVRSHLRRIDRSRLWLPQLLNR